MNVQAAAREHLGSTFAGLWADPGTTRVTVAATGSLDQAVRDLIRSHGPGLDIGFVEADHSLTDLDAIARSLPADLPWHIAGADQVNNTVRVEADPDGEDLLRAHFEVHHAGVAYGVVASPRGSSTQIVDACVSRTQCAPVARGGVEIFIGASARCSSGFNGERNGQPVMFTAGHCGPSGQPITHSGIVWGTILASQFSGDTDGAVYSQTASWTPTNWVYRTDNSKSTRILGRKTTSAQYIGELICKLGVTTNMTCGQVTHLNQSINVGGVLLTGPTFTNACALFGDSGGSIISEGIAMGVSSAARIYDTDAGTPYCPG